MNLPISSATNLAAIGARKAGDLLAKQFGKMSEFAEVLAGSPESAEPNADRALDATSNVGDPQADALRRELLDSIQRALGAAGISLNQPLELSVQDDGSLRVASNHPRGAEIEARLQEDADVQRLSRAWRASQRENAGTAEGFGRTSIGLTVPDPKATILPSSGGYPNW